MLHLWLRALCWNFFLINCLSHFTCFWDWIKCRVSDGLLYRLSLEPAARLVNQFSRLIPSFNAHKYVYPEYWVPEKEFLFKASQKYNHKVRRKICLQPSSSILGRLYLTTKTNTTFVFWHILKYVNLWSESKNTFRHFCLIVDFQSLVVIIIIFVKL